MSTYSKSRRLGQACLHVTAILLIAPCLQTAKADDINGTGWLGTGGSQNWGYYNNWDSTNPSQGERNLFFGNAWYNAGKSGQTRAYNDLSGYSGYGITFQDNGTNNNTTFTLDGNAITQYDFGGNSPFVTNMSYLPQNDNLNTTFQSSTGTASINDTHGNITMGGTVTLSSGTALNLTGAAGGAISFSSTVANSTAININDNVNVNFSGIVSGNGMLTKQGTGIAVLSAANTYAGGTTINAGTLRANSSDATYGSTGGGNVAVNNGGTLAGVGRVVGNVNIATGGTITAGSGAGLSDGVDQDSTGTLRTGTETWNAGGIYAAKFASTTGSAGAGWDELVMDTLNLQATAANKFDIKLVNSSGGALIFAPHQQYVIAHFNTAVSNPSSVLSALYLDTSGIGANTDSFSLTFGTSNGSDLFLDTGSSNQGNPEPATAALTLLTGSIFMGRRSRKTTDGCLRRIFIAE